MIRRVAMDNSRAPFDICVERALRLVEAVSASAHRDSWWGDSEDDLRKMKAFSFFRDSVRDFQPGSNPYLLPEECHIYSREAGRLSKEALEAAEKSDFDRKMEVVWQRMERSQRVVQEILDKSAESAAVRPESLAMMSVHLRLEDRFREVTGAYFSEEIRESLVRELTEEVFRASVRAIPSPAVESLSDRSRTVLAETLCRLGGEMAGRFAEHAFSQIAQENYPAVRKSCETKPDLVLGRDRELLHLSAVAEDQRFSRLLEDRLAPLFDRLCEYPKEEVSPAPAAQSPAPDSSGPSPFG